MIILYAREVSYFFQCTAYRGTKVAKINFRFYGQLYLVFEMQKIMKPKQRSGILMVKFVGSNKS